jgi:integrase
MVRWAVVGATTGMRPGEQCARTWEDWRGDHLEIWTSVYETDVADRRVDPALPRFLLGDLKVGEGRSIRLTAECMTALNRQRSAIEAMLRLGRITADAAAFLFPGQLDERPHTNPARIYERWRSLLRGEKSTRRGAVAESLPGVRYITPYGLRHTHATELLRAGRSIKFVADRLGTSIQMIDRHYGHILREIEAEAIDTLPPLGFDCIPSVQP